MKKLSVKYSDITAEVEWAEQCMGDGEGRYELKNGKILSEYYPETQKEQSVFSDRVWNEGYGLQRTDMELTQ